MTPDQIEDRLRAMRPSPTTQLRERVLAAVARTERRPPWWARVSTWSTAAAVLLVCDLTLTMESGGPPHPAPASTRPAFVVDADIAAVLSPLQLSCLQRPQLPRPGRTITPYTPYAEVL